jgi:hypothetical protein
MLREGTLSREEDKRPTVRDGRAVGLPDRAAAGLVAPIRL